MSVALTIAPAIRFHLSLNVSHLPRSVEFYRVLLGCEPAKLRNDYAKFELNDPPLVLSLEPHAPAGGGVLNHTGFRMAEVAQLIAMQERLERAGIHTDREEGVECCYARQTKFWVYDPDRTLWEIYTLDEDIDHRGAGQSKEKIETSMSDGKLPVICEHRMNVPVPERLPHDDASVEQVLLRGSFNLNLSPPNQRRLLSEALRILRPGGRLFVHVLTGEKAYPGGPGLPGPAAAIERVPTDSEIMTLLDESGFESVRMIKFDAKPCFIRDGVAMRETQIEAWKPMAPGTATAAVIYKGPFRETKDDAGNVYPRGRRVAVDGSAVDRLESLGLSDSFLILRSE